MFRRSARGPGCAWPSMSPAALLHIGDVHALQGDGEIGGSAIETSGVIRLRVALMERPQEMTWPRIVTSDRIMTVASGRPAERALRLAASELIRWLHADYGLEPQEALLLLSQVLEARATQVVQPDHHLCGRYQARDPEGVVTDSPAKGTDELTHTQSGFGLRRGRCAPLARPIRLVERTRAVAADSGSARPGSRPGSPKISPAGHRTDLLRTRSGAQSFDQGWDRLAGGKGESSPRAR